MPTTPPWKAAKNGFPNDLDGEMYAAQVNQELGTHNSAYLYTGTRVLNPTAGGTQLIQFTPGNALDLSQPFTLSGTSVGRVVLPVLPSGNGADLRVSLYPDLAGSPDTTNCLASTEIPANWITNLTAQFGLNNSSSVLQTANTNTAYATGSITVNTWASPAGNSSGVAGNAGFVTSGDYMIFVGGSAGGVSTNTVATAQYLGGTSLGLPVAQPPLPKAVFYPSCAATPTGFVTAGGVNTTPAIADVWTASWDPNTGQLGQWSAQAALPSARWGAGAASWGETVYLVGGTPDGATLAYSQVLYTTLDNGQVSSWNFGPALPQGTMSPMVCAVNGWLFCIGGCTIAASPFTDVWMSKIAADGSLGGWQRGPSLQTAVYSFAPGWDVAVAGDDIVILGGFTSPSTTTAALQVLSTTADTVGVWRKSNWNPANVEEISAFDIGGGQFALVNPVTDSSFYRTSTLAPEGALSVPLYATGLTNGSVYHVVVQQHQTMDAMDYLEFGLLDTALPIHTLSRSRNTGAWTDFFGSWAMPMEVYNADGTGDRLHVWEDPSVTGSGYTSNVASKVDYQPTDFKGVILGYCDATLLPNDPLNSNPTFTSGVSPWTATNGTITQSNAQTHGGFPFSGLLTPTGGNALAFTSTEILPIGTSQAVLSTERWLLANAWVYVPTTWAGVSMSVNWYDSAGAFISTTSNTKSVTGATWTNLVNYALAPITAAFARLVPTLSGTPTAANTLFLSNATLAFSPETSRAVSTAVSVVYDPATALPVSTVLL